MSKPYMKVTSDFTQKFNEIVKQFKHDDVLVGIPEEKSDRKDDAPISNAAILAINEFGSPMNNIPPRPVMKRGISRAQPEISEEFRKAAIAGLKGDPNAVYRYYERAGILAANSVKKVINEQDGIAPPAAGTLAARKSKGFKGTKALIVTGQMRNAITSVVRRKA